MSRGSVRVSTANPTPVFAALGDQTRLWLVKNLSDGKARSIAKLSVDLNLTRQAVTKHLHVLERAGVVSNVRVGRESHFSYRPEAIADARSYLQEVSAQWDNALSRLRLHVER